MNVKPLRPVELPKARTLVPPRPAADPVEIRAATAPVAAAPDENALRDLTARIAYDLYEKRGRADGHDFEDWLEAERLASEQLRQRKP